MTDVREFDRRILKITESIVDRVLVGQLDLPTPCAEWSLGQLFPAPQAISFHAVDYLVHGWDVSATLGIPADFDDDILDAVLPIAAQVPDGASRRRAGTAFQPGLDQVAGSSVLDRILVLLGRSPSWPD